MQSIYGFRYADVALFLNARQGYFGGIPLEPVTLSQNFALTRNRGMGQSVFAELMGRDRPIMAASDMSKRKACQAIRQQMLA